MRKLIIISILCFLSVFAKGQVYQLMPQYGYDAKRMNFDSTLSIPSFCGAPSLLSNKTKKAAIAYDSCNNRFYYYNPKTLVWDFIKSVDTTSLSNRINLKLNISDTSGMLSVYLRKIDTTNKWVNSVTKLNDSTIQVVKGTTTSDITISSVTSATRLITKVWNNTGVTIPRGSVVYISGRHSSNLPTIAVAEANNEENSYKTFALVDDDILDNSSGFVTQAGKISGLNLPTSTYTDGDIVYLSPTVPGGYTTTKPLAPYHIVKLGSVTRAHPTQGSIEVKIENGWQLDELSDVQIPLVPNDSALLQFSRVDSLWHSVSPSTAIGNRYIKPSDTTAMLSPYLRSNVAAATYQPIGSYLTPSDTTSLSNRINLKVNISDTSTMLSPYLRKIDTASLSNRINLKLNISDTSNKWITNVFRKTASDSVFYVKGGTNTFAFKDSTGGGSAANPTASVGLTAVNGSASTFMRSDAAPALDQSIAPTWTGLHTFNRVLTVSAASATTAPILGVTNTSSGNFTFMVNNSGTGNSNFGFQIDGTNKATIGYSRASNYLGLFNQTASPNYFLARLNSDASFTHNRTSDGTADFTITDGGKTTIGSSTSSIDGSYLQVRNDANSGTYQTIVNTTSGTAAYSGLFCTQTSGLTDNLVGIRSNSAAFTSSGINVASGASVSSFGLTAGLNLGTTNSAQLGFWTNNTERARFFATGNLAIGTSTDAGYKLDVNGTARVQGALTATGSITAASAIARGTYLNQTLTAAANNDTLVGLDIRPTFTNGAFTGVSNLGLRVNGEASIINNSINATLNLRNNNTAGVAAANLFNSSGVNVGAFGYAGSTYSGTALQDKLYFYTPKDFIITPNGSTNYFRVFTSTGNIAINSTTDAGYKLDVNGTARVQGNTTFGTIGTGTGMFWDNTNNRLGIGTSTPTFAFEILKSTNGAERMNIKNNSNGTAAQALYNAQNDAGNSFQMGIFGSGTTASGIISANDVYLQANTTGHLNIQTIQNSPIKFGINATSGSNIEKMRISTNGSLLIGTTSETASAKLVVESTTQGFLPPRMTTTQRDAISSPAAGLIIYDTTVNKVSVYNGTAWKYLLYE